jgi:hypothetical protein
MPPLVNIISDGRTQVDTKGALCEIQSSFPPQESFTEVLSRVSTTIQKRHPEVTSNALSNTRGAWYEWLLAASAWNWHFRHSSYLAVLLPNMTQFDIADLYEPRLCGFIQDLRSKVTTHTSVKLVTSNPDFVIVDVREMNLELDLASEISHFDRTTLDSLDQLYRRLIGKCTFKNLIGYISVKSSLRPDRRLQIPHEGSLMKAIYAHLQTRDWVINPPGLRYYAISSVISDADRDALKTVATHSITTVNELPKAAVDAVFQINSQIEAEATWESILTAK